MPSSTEVLASPPQQRRPLLRAVLGLLGLGLVAWAVVARLVADDPADPAAAPTSPATASATSARPAPSRPPPWVRYETPLEGRWVMRGPGGPLTLLVKNAYVDLFQGIGEKHRLTFGRRVMFVMGHRVHVETPEFPGETATYIWRIEGDRLSFKLVEKTPRSAALLAGLSFRRQD